MDDRTLGSVSPAKPAILRSDSPNGQIALKLRTFYQSLQEEALPGRFLDLLESLDAAEIRAQGTE